MKPPAFAAMLLLIAACGVCASDAASPGGDWVLWYTRPADKWIEALPVGNGRLGAMVFGGVPRERIQLNEDTVWAGYLIDRDRVGAYKHLPEARRLCFEGKYAEAQGIMQREFMGERLIRSYQTLGDLSLEFESGGQITDYRRRLDLDTAIVRVTYRRDNATFTREVFSSPVDQVLAVRLSCDNPGRISLRATLERPENYTTQAVGPDELLMRGYADQDGQHRGVDFAARLKAVIHGGKAIVQDATLEIEKADAVTLLLSAETNYPTREAQPSKRCKSQLEAAAQKSYDELRAAHVAEHRRLFRRVDIDLGKTDAVNLPTDQRLQAVKQGAQDPHLIALYFQFGRYLLLSCSRPGCMPSNLQGLWCEHIKAPWNCDYHININVQMNYWPAEVCNLTECHEPFFDLIDNLRAQGRKTARGVYGCGGFCAHHTTDGWWWTSPIGNVGYGMWPLGAAWCCQHLWEHYRFTGDREFLEKRGYPIMKEAAEFCLDFLAEDPQTGKLVSGPSTSPENRFRTPDGKTANLSMGCAMDQEIIWDLFTNCLEGAEVLGIEDDFVRRVRDARSRLGRPKIGSDGRLMEWSEEFEEPEPRHRHMSHLFALHPSQEITLRGTPDLAEAARKSIEARLAHGGGHTGWSRAWIINFFARLEDADRAYENVRALLQKRTHPNLFNGGVFQIDGNLGGTAGIAEMLLQSHADEIALLPAWPKAAWPTGHVKGLRARGGVEVDIAWQDGRATSATLRTTLTGPLSIRPPKGQYVTAVRSQGQKIALQEGPGGAVLLSKALAGVTYEVTFK